MMLVLQLPTPPQHTSRPTHSLPAPASMTSSLRMPLSTSHAVAPRPAPPRPRLSINTHQSRTFGKGSSLSLDTLSAVSPTARNTFSNGYEPRTSRPSTTPLDQTQPLTPATPEPQEEATTPSSASVSSASTIAEPYIIPYKQPHALRSALVNSLVPRSEFRRMSIGPSRPMFPRTKHVSFKTPLEEEIKTTKYTLAHSDIEPLSLVSVSQEPASSSIDTNLSDCSDLSSLSDSTSSLLSTSSSSSSSSSPRLQPTARRVSHRLGKMRTSPRTGEKRDSSSDSDSDTCPETPVAGRRKRRKEFEWAWTLGPIAPGAAAEVPEVVPEQTTSWFMPSPDDSSSALGGALGMEMALDSSEATLTDTTTSTSTSPSEATSLSLSISSSDSSAMSSFASEDSV